MTAPGGMALSAGALALRRIALANYDSPLPSSYAITAV
jgi:hypothetical protein